VHILVTNISTNKQLHRQTRHPPRGSYRRDPFVNTNTETDNLI